MIVSDQTLKLAKLSYITFKEKNINCVYSSDKLNQTFFSVQDLYFIFYNLLPFLDNKNFYTRKFLHFQCWSIIIKFKMAGYLKRENGELIANKIIQNMNNTSYSNNNNKSINSLPLPGIDEINNLIFNTNIDNLNFKNGIYFGPFVISVLPEVILDFEKKKGIWVYENDKLVEGSPFVSLRQAALAINSPNSTKSFKVDTGILFKGKYTFYSKPKNNF